MKIFKTIVAGWVPVSIAERLESLAKEKHVTTSKLIGDLLSVHVTGKPMDHTPRPTRNIDGREDEAIRIITQFMETRSVPELVDILAGSGIKRGKTWVGDRRAMLRRAKQHSNT